LRVAVGLRLLHTLRAHVLVLGTHLLTLGHSGLRLLAMTMHLRTLGEAAVRLLAHLDPFGALRPLGEALLARLMRSKGLAPHLGSCEPVRTAATMRRREHVRATAGCGKVVRATAPTAAAMRSLGLRPAAAAATAVPMAAARSGSGRSRDR